VEVGDLTMGYLFDSKMKKDLRELVVSLISEGEPHTACSNSETGNMHKILFLGLKEVGDPAFKF
jgi:hypothetical protein